MCLEALIHYYTDADPRAIDRMMRAQLLSGAFRQTDLLAFTSAWLAHLSFHGSRPAELARSLLLATQSVRAEDEEALCRTVMTLGDITTYLGDFAAAKAWYSKAHRLCVSLGDHAFISALTYNKPAMAAFSSRLHKSLDAEFGADPTTFEFELRTAHSYQSAAGVTSHPGMQNVAYVAASMVIGNYKLAEERIDKAIGELKGVALEANRLPLMADKALCEAQLGRLDASVNLIGEVVGADWSSVDADDQLIMASALHDAAEIAGSVLPSFLDGRVMELRAEVNEKLSRMKVDLAALLAWQLDGLQ
jgi:tetratricopeptide (TPR) repeat protein